MDWMDKSNREIIAQSLNMWANWIQTGDPTTTPTDCENMKEEYRIKPLSIDQMEFIIRLHKLAKKIRYKEN